MKSDDKGGCMRIRFALAPVVLLALALGGCAATGLEPSGAPTAPTGTPTPTKAAPAQRGSISGTLVYPSEFIPPLAIYAISAADASVHFHVETARDQQSYTITGVAAGTYHVVAYPLAIVDPNAAAGYTQCAIRSDSQSAACTAADHQLLPVTVGAGRNVGDIGPNDWFAPPGTFPPRPR